MLKSAQVQTKLLMIPVMCMLYINVEKNMGTDLILFVKTFSDARQVFSCFKKLLPDFQGIQTACDNFLSMSRSTISHGRMSRVKCLFLEQNFLKLLPQN